jgi:hypothetical protein
MSCLWDRAYSGSLWPCHVCSHLPSRNPQYVCGGPARAVCGCVMFVVGGYCPAAARSMSCLWRAHPDCPHLCPIDNVISFESNDKQDKIESLLPSPTREARAGSLTSSRSLRFWKR